MAHVARDRRAAAALLDPEKHRILELLQEPESASGLARRLGVSRQRVNYHVKHLENAGLVELAEERRKGNCVERILRACSTSYYISPEALGRLGRTVGAEPDRVSAAYLVQAAAGALRDVACLSDRARETGKTLATLTLESDIRFASAEDRNAFAGELATMIAKLASRYHKPGTPGGRTFRLLTACYPAVPRKDT